MVSNYKCCSLPPPFTTTSLLQCPTRSTSPPRRTRKGPRTGDLGHLARPRHLELPGKGFKNYKARKQEKQERHESNCPDRPSRKRIDSCQPLEIFGPLPTSKLEHILIYKNDSLGPPWAESCPQANCLGATPTGSARGALDDALLQPESFWGSELLFGVPGKHTQRLTPTKHHIYVRRWTNPQKDAGLLQYQTFTVSVSEV